MDKLLHERLREWAVAEPPVIGRDCIFNFISGVEGCPDIDSCKKCDKAQAAILADEIERYYIPRPRFEDGEPVQFGDELELLDTVDEMTFYQNGIVSVGHDGNTFTVNPGERLKRPTPKVLDADGAPIKVGDTVYEVKTGLRSTVTSTTMLDSNGNTVCCKDGCPGELHYKPEELTHQEPDSLEKLRDDMRRAMTESPDARFMESSWVDRLTALIERGGE